jgi:pimeloyl-ACP methyl ester carboxylesterase
VQRILGRDRSVYAPDLPGYGNSDPPPEPPTIKDYAAAIGDFIDTMRLRQIDLLGCQTGALIAAELAISRPQQVRRVVWTAVPIVNDVERGNFQRSPWPGAISEDGSHLQREWRRVASLAKLPLPVDIAARRVAAILASGANASWGMHAAGTYPARERLGRVTQPVLVLRAADEFWESSVRVREFVPKARIVDFPAYGTGLCEVAPDAVADAVAKFLKS